MMDDYDVDAVRDGTGRVLEGPHKHLRVLERRMSFLTKRIAKGAQEGKSLTHDEHERDALEWAVEQLDEIVKDE